LIYKYFLDIRLFGIIIDNYINCSHKRNYLKREEAIDKKWPRRRKRTPAQNQKISKLFHSKGYCSNGRPCGR